MLILLSILISIVFYIIFHTGKKEDGVFGFFQNHAWLAPLISEVVFIIISFVESYMDKESYVTVSLTFVWIVMILFITLCVWGGYYIGYLILKFDEWLKKDDES